MHPPLRLSGKVIVSTRHSNDPDKATSASIALSQALGTAENVVAAYLTRQRPTQPAQPLESHQHSLYAGLTRGNNYRGDGESRPARVPGRG